MRQALPSIMSRREGRLDHRTRNQPVFERIRCFVRALYVILPPPSPRPIILLPILHPGLIGRILAEAHRARTSGSKKKGDAGESDWKRTRYDIMNFETGAGNLV